MAKYPESTKHSLESRLGSQASARWPQLASIAVRHRANFTYVDGVWSVPGSVDTGRGWPWN